MKLSPLLVIHKKTKMNNSFNFLGLAKKANAILIGQDDVLFALQHGIEMFVLISSDVSTTLLRKIQTKASATNSSIVKLGLSRGEIGSLLGIRSASVLAIKKDNSFAEKLKQIELCKKYS